MLRLLTSPALGLFPVRSTKKPKRFIPVQIQNRSVVLQRHFIIPWNTNVVIGIVVAGLTCLIYENNSILYAQENDDEEKKKETSQSYLPNAPKLLVHLAYSNKLTLKRKAIQGLAHWAEKEDEETANIIIKEGGLDVIQYLIDTENDAIVQEQAFRTLTALSKREIAKPYLLQDDWFNIYQTKLEDNTTSPSIINYISLSLRSLSNHADIILSAHLKQQGVTKLLRQIVELKVEDTAVIASQKAIVSETFLELAKQESLRKYLLSDEDSIKALQQLGMSLSPDVIRNLSVFFVEVTQTDEARKPLVHSALLSILTKISTSDNREVRLNCALAITNLLENDEAAIVIMRKYGIELLVMLADYADIDIKHAVERAFVLLRSHSNKKLDLTTKDTYVINDKFELK